LSSKRDATDKPAPGGDGTDLEDKPTELWAPAARSLFADQQAPRDLPDFSSAPDGGNVPDTQPDLPQHEPGPEEHEAEQVAMRELEGHEPEEHEPEDHDTVMDTVEMSPQEAAAAIAEAQVAAENMDPHAVDARGEVDTLEIPAREMLAMVDELSDTVEVSGEEGEAARRLAEEEQVRRRFDPSATLVVDTSSMPKLSHECRMCGRKVSRPEPRRLRGPLQSDKGFRCEKCNNVFCAAHVVRVSGLLESLFGTGRFRCQLCLPEVTQSK